MITKEMLRAELERTKMVQAELERAKTDPAINTPEGHQKHFETLAIILGVRPEQLPFSLAQIKKALDDGDCHLNTLPLKKWDNAYLPFPLSLSTKVCILKAAAKFFVKGIK